MADILGSRSTGTGVIDPSIIPPLLGCTHLTSANFSANVGRQTEYQMIKCNWLNTAGVMRKGKENHLCS